MDADCCSALATALWLSGVTGKLSTYFGTVRALLLLRSATSTAMSPEMASVAMGHLRFLSAALVRGGAVVWMQACGDHCRVRGVNVTAVVCGEWMQLGGGHCRVRGVDATWW